MDKCKKKNVTERPIINCLWAGCNFECKSVWELNNHIESHVEADFNQKQRLNLTSARIKRPCPWLECAFTTKCSRDLERHVLYHGYYAGLLAQGEFECSRNASIPECHAPSVNRVPELKDDFRCEWTDCARSFVSIVRFQDHIEQHVNFEYEIQKTPENERPQKIKCNWSYCKRQLDNKYRLMEHIRTHTNKKEVACHQCGELFRTKTTLFDHRRRQPDNNTHGFQCAQCYKYFSTEKLLRNHVVKHVNCFKCNLCDMTCPTKSSLATHIRYRHLKDKPFKCKDCDKRFVRQSDVVKHVQFVHTKEVHRCHHTGCYYAVQSYNLLRRHFLEVHSNSPIIYMCHCCDKTFKSGKSLSVHLIKKHDFQLPSGHKRFTYRVDENGFYRLETMRIESLEVTNQIQRSPNQIEMSEVTQDSSCYEIVSMTNENDERLNISNDPIKAQFVGEVSISISIQSKDDIMNEK